VRILSIVHQADAGAGVFGEVARSQGHDLREWNPATEWPEPDPATFDAAFTFGGAMNVKDNLPSLGLEKQVLAGLHDAGIPTLGVCLGAELLADVAGGSVERVKPEIGWCEATLTDAGFADPVLGTLPSSFRCFQWHSYGFTPPPGSVELAKSPACSQAFRLGETWAIQFHAEVILDDAELWIDDYRSDPDAVAMDLDTAALRAETRELIRGWNELGRGLCRAFLAYAET
jgi:GMP synthase-like glutamine amidotransferase